MESLLKVVGKILVHTRPI